MLLAYQLRLSRYDSATRSYHAMWSNGVGVCYPGHDLRLTGCVPDPRASEAEIRDAAGMGRCGITAQQIIQRGQISSVHIVTCGEACIVTIVGRDIWDEEAVSARAPEFRVVPERTPQGECS
jgi:hypothetical protein